MLTLIMLNDDTIIIMTRIKNYNDNNDNNHSTGSDSDYNNHDKNIND